MGNVDQSCLTLLITIDQMWLVLRLKESRKISLAATLATVVAVLLLCLTLLVVAIEMT